MDDDDGVGYCKDCTEHLGEGESWNHPTMTEEEFDRRTIQLLLEEVDNPVEWYYLSFARSVEEGGFLGGLYIRGMGTMSAVTAASHRNLNPGGEVLCWGPISDEDMDAHVPEADRNRLLTKEELDAQST